MHYNSFYLFKSWIKQLVIWNLQSTLLYNFLLQHNLILVPEAARMINNYLPDSELFFFLALFVHNQKSKARIFV